VAFSNPKLTFWGWADYTLRAEFQPLFSSGCIVAVLVRK